VATTIDGKLKTLQAEGAWRSTRDVDVEVVVSKAPVIASHAVLRAMRVCRNISEEAWLWSR